MPRRSILSSNERDSFFALPESRDELIRFYTFNETDLSIIRQHRGAANRLGFAVQLCYMRYPGIILAMNESPNQLILKIVAEQLKINANTWTDYGQRENTRWEHLAELQRVFGFQTFTMQHYRQSVHQLENVAYNTDKGILLATELVAHLRRQNILLPAISTIERACSEALTRANKRIYLVLTDSLSGLHQRRLNELLKRKEGSNTTWLAWLRQSPAKPNSRYMLEHFIDAT